MLYINLDDSGIEVLQAEKSILGDIKIVSCARRESPEGFIINGLIVEADKLKDLLRDLFSSGYPKSIRGSDIVLSIPDKQIFIERFSYPKAIDNNNLQEYIISEAKKLLPYDPVELVNFFKIIDESKDSMPQVLYTAILRHTLLHFGRVMKKLNLKINFLSSKSFAIFEFIKYLIGENEKILYISCGKNNSDYYLFDKHGPLSNDSKKTSSKNFIKESKTIIDELEKGKNVNISKIIVGGIESINLEVVQVSESVGRQVVKLGQIFDNLTEKLKIKIDTGGIPGILFAEALGLLLLTQSKTPANFSEDLYKMDLSKDFEEEIENTKKKEKMEPLKEKEPVFPLISEELQVVEYKESLLGKLLKYKWVTGLMALVILGIAVIGVIRTSEGRIQIPFLATPTLVPSPTVIPTITPFPTVDPKLKRTDLEISVQNGTSKAGFAKDIASFLEEKGYQNVAKGNADRDDYEETLIKIKPSKKAYLTLVITDLKDKLLTSNIQELGEEDSFDTVIILGAK